MMHYKNKISDIASLREQLRGQPHTKIVFTNGCFDLLHPGHIAYLAAARSLGDLLIVGLNSDASVTRLKGTERPINTVADRAIMLAALQSVDYVVVFEEDTPQRLISDLMPHVLVKGGDYTKETIVGSKIVEDAGGEVHVIAFEPGYSSTNIIKKIRSI